MFIYPWGDMHSLNLGWFLLQFKDWVEKIQEYLDNGGGTSENLANVIAPVFNAANTYAAGDYVLYNNELYKANQAVNPGTWNPDAWDNCLIVDEMGSGGGSAGVDNVARLMIAGQYSASFAYQKYGICRYNDKLWMCNTNLPAGGEAWDPAHWDEITVGAGLTGLRRSVETLVESINNFRPNQLKRKWIFIGDSYGHASGSNNGWIDKLVALMGLSSSDYFESAVGGYSFTWEGSQFITLLQNLATTITDKNAITDIVVLGGANDLGQSADAISAAIEAFNSYAYTTFPNAVVRIGMISGNADYTKVVSQYSRVKEGYANCGKAQYLNNLEYVFQNRNLIGSDNIHPTAEGYNILANKIFEALNGGCSVIYREFGAPVAPSGYVNITTANFYNVFVNNGVTQIAVANRPGKATTDSTKYFPVRANTAIELCRLPTKIFLPPAIGPENGLVCPCIARVLSTVNNTSYQIKGYAILAGENRTLYFLPNDIILGTTSAFDSCNQIEIDAASFTCASICC